MKLVVLNLAIQNTESCEPDHECAKSKKAKNRTAIYKIYETT